MASFNFTQLGSEFALVRYNGKKDLDDILHWLWNNYDFKCLALEMSVKDEGEAEELRSLGNQLYKDRNYEKALELYNQSIRTALHPTLSNENVTETEGDSEFAFPLINPIKYGGVAIEKCIALGKGYANRSAVMLVLKEYDKCLQDIDLAIEYGYPEEFRPKLEERRLKCEAALRQENMPNPKLKIADKPTSSLKKRLSAKVLTPPELLDPNPNISAFSSAAKVSYFPSKGRGLVATRSIKPGEVLAVERALVISLGRDHLTTNCSTCTIQCLNPLPCPKCSQVVFCSKACRARGLSEDHWLDCKILKSVHVHHLYSRASSYKMLKTFNFRHIKPLLDKLESDQNVPHEQLGFDNKGRYSSFSFQSIYSLHQIMENDSVEEIMAECIYAFKLTKLLELSEQFFTDDHGNPVLLTKEDFLQTSKLLVMNYYKSALNAFCQAGYQVTGSFLFPAVSLFNHSCSPNVSHSSFGRFKCCYALKPIEAGEELSICYIDPFNIQGKSQRRERLLRNRGFVCNCQPCEENWPTSQFLPEFRILCTYCNKAHLNLDMYCSDCMNKLRRKKAPTKGVELIQNSKKLKLALDLGYRLEHKVFSQEPITKEDFLSVCEASECAFKNSIMPCTVLTHLMGSVEACADAGLL